MKYQGKQRPQGFSEEPAKPISDVLLGFLGGIDEIDGFSERVWAGGGAVAAKDIRRELRRAASKAGLAEAPTPLGVRHLFATLCDDARLSSAVTRHLMGHRPQRGDSLPKYTHKRLAVLREQVAILDERRKSLIAALSRRAAELARRR